MSRGGTLAALLAALLLAGCGGSDDEDSQPPPEPAPAPSPAPRESVDHLPKLPDRWTRHVNPAGGFAIGLPPGWKASDRRGGTLVRSFDRLVALSITPDRSEAALEVPIEDFATRAADALAGFRGGLDAKGMRRFGHRYAGTEVRAEGKAKGGIEQRVSVIVLRRKDLATFTIVIAANAEESAAPSRRLAERVVGTLRGRPPREPAEREGEREGERETSEGRERDDRQEREEEDGREREDGRGDDDRGADDGGSGDQ